MSVLRINKTIDGEQQAPDSGVEDGPRDHGRETVLLPNPA